MIEEYLAGNCPVGACNLPDKCFAFTMADALFWTVLIGSIIITYSIIKRLEKQNPKEASK